MSRRLRICRCGLGVALGPRRRRDRRPGRHLRGHACRHDLCPAHIAVRFVFHDCGTHYFFSALPLLVILFFLVLPLFPLSLCCRRGHEDRACPHRSLVGAVQYNSPLCHARSLTPPTGVCQCAEPRRRSSLTASGCGSPSHRPMSPRRAHLLSPAQVRLFVLRARAHPPPTAKSICSCATAPYLGVGPSLPFPMCMHQHGDVGVCMSVCDMA